MPGIMPASGPKPMRPPRPGGGPCAKRLAAAHSPTRIKFRFINLPPWKWRRLNITAYSGLRRGGEKFHAEGNFFFDDGGGGREFGDLSAAGRFAAGTDQEVCPGTLRMWRW